MFEHSGMASLIRVHMLSTRAREQKVFVQLFHKGLVELV